MYQRVSVFYFLPLRLVPTSLLPPLLCHCCDRCYRSAWLAWNKTCQCLAEQRNDWWRQLILRSRTQKKSETRKHWKQRSPCNMRIWYRENIWKIRSDVLLCNTMYEYTSVVLWILWAKISPSGHRSAKLTTSWRGHIAALVTLLQKSPILQLFCRSTFTSCDNIWQHFRTALRSLSKCHQIPIGFVCIAA